MKKTDKPLVTTFPASAFFGARWPASRAIYAFGALVSRMPNAAVGARAAATANQGKR